MTQDQLQLIGYLGSALVGISMTMKSLLRLRLINVFGALTLLIYGLLIHAYPVAALNSLIVGIDIYYLIQMWRQKDYFKLLEVRPDSAYLKSFVEYYREGVTEYFPNYKFDPHPEDVAVFVLRNMVPAGALVVHQDGDQARVVLDFVIPGYRDFRAGRFLFEESAGFFRQRGITCFTSEPGIPRHEAYLKRMGFQARDGLYYRSITPASVVHDHGM